MRWEDRQARKALVAKAYAAGGTVDSVCEDHQCSKTFLYRAIEEMGVPRRAALPRLIASGATAPPGAAGPGGAPPGDGSAGVAGLQGRLERLLADRIAALERRAALGREGDPEAVARALSLNARTLATLRRVGPGGDDGQAEAADSSGRSLSQLRDELRKRLHQLRDEGRARHRLRRLGADGGGVPAAAGPLAPEREPAGPAAP